ncbi:uncharacterized protein F4822DRAFT_346934 [Hypoxylon trugodes]|uniref:uncharacterized protein n=1 Tax=Hypoxylon trugodes TaxID=326681 RepID=UPI00219F9034|nr:uncharacterized protein F4822DRAFT_346934 [Hypoxylon trugodes]KAI1385541.1 hypothetical protein F4822DRAFT_346934 [Hypoxylon trugodes]
MPCRKFHRNSHHGCIQCKSRRVKCDQEQPTCARCRSKGRACTYRHLTSSYNPFGGHDIADTTSLRSPSAPLSSHTALTSTQAASSPALTILPLYKTPLALDPITEQLIYHYDAEVSSIFTSPDVQVEVLSCLHDAVARHSFEYPYVYHAMLTVSALHLVSHARTLEAASQTRSPHLVTALSHKASALETLRSTVNSITPITCEPALIASGLLTVCAFASLRAGVVTDTIDLLAQIMTLYRGSVAIFRLGRLVLCAVPGATIPALRQSVLSATAGEKSWPSAEAAVNKVLARISELGDDYDDAKQRKQSLLDAGFKLKTALRRAAGAIGNYNVACMWLAMVHPTFNESIVARDPLGLILVSHWVVTLKYVKHLWWVQGWPEQIAQAVWQEVGERHPDLMQWVFEEINKKSEDELDGYLILKGS